MANFRIAVNTRLLIPNKLEGIGRFTQETMLRIVQQHPEVDFYFYFDRRVPTLPQLSNLKSKQIWPPARRTFLFDWWFNRSITRQLKRDSIDLFLSPDGFLSLKTEVPQLAVIHDLNFEHHPELLPPKIADYYQDRFPKFAAKALRIATVSQYSKQDIVSTYGIAPHKIDVVYNGVSSEFQPSSVEIKQQTKAQYTGGAEYFVYVGSIHPRKNIKRMFEAFVAYRVNGGKFKMVIVGAS
ncbi:MAG: glycosyltransferase, partial [Flavobacteriales bacterium]